MDILTVYLSLVLLIWKNLSVSGYSPSDLQPPTLFVTVPAGTSFDTPDDGYLRQTSPSTWNTQQFSSGTTPGKQGIMFMADDHSAAEKISELLTTLQAHKKLRNVFPDSRSRGTITSTTRKDVSSPYSVITSPSTTGGMPRSVLEEETFTQKGVTDSGGSSRDVDGAASRHHFTGYRPQAYKPPPRKPFRPPPPVRPGSPYSQTIFGGHNKRPSTTSFFKNMTRVLHIEAECQDEFMRIHVQFNGSFSGLIYSSGYAYDSDCIYVNGSGRASYDFYIQLNRCGTLGGNERKGKDVRGRDATKNMMWNTLTVQYNPLIEEEWDEHFKVTCEYGYDFWKTVTFPFLDVEVQTGNPVVFTLTPPECHMEIRYGYGPEGTRVTGPVRVGDPLTLVIYMRSESDGFDIVVSDCYAHNGSKKKINLIDHYGCPVDEKLISHFDGSLSSNNDRYETQVFAFMKTFRFTGSPALYIECDVRMCHGDCPTQPCHWRRQSKKVKRSAHSTLLEQSSEGGLHGNEGTVSSTLVDGSVNGNVSNSFKMSQSLKVMGEEDMHLVAPIKLDKDDVCVTVGTFYALSGMVVMLIAVMLIVCTVMCIRVKKLKKASDCSSRPSIYIPTYKSDYVPPSKRRLE